MKVQKTVKILAYPSFKVIGLGFKLELFFEIPENVEHEVHALVDSYLYLIK